MTGTDITQLKSRYVAFMREVEELEKQDALEKASILVRDIRQAGSIVIDQEQQEELEKLIVRLGDVIFDLSGKYPLMRLDPLSPRGVWLRQLGFKLDPFLYTDGGSDPYLQEYFYKVSGFFDILGSPYRLGVVIVFGPPGSGKSSLRNVVAQMSRTEGVLSVVYRDFGPLVDEIRQGREVQIYNHIEQILKAAIRTLDAELRSGTIALTESGELDQVIRDQLWYYVSAYEEDPIIKRNLRSSLKPEEGLSGELPIDPRESLARFCRYVTELFRLQSIYFLVDPDDGISSDEDIAWQVLEPLLSKRRLLEFSDNSVAFKFFLDNRFLSRVLETAWINQEQSQILYSLEWSDEELHRLLRERLRLCSDRKPPYLSLGQISIVDDLDHQVVRLSRGTPRELVVICNKLFNEHCRLSPINREHILITRQEVQNVLGAFRDKAKPSSLGELITQGESSRLELKPTMRYHLRARRRDSKVDKEIAKTLCALMNTEGGTLIIGVDDEGRAVGLDKDMATLSRGRKDRDGFEKAFADLVVRYLGRKPQLYIETGFDEYQGKTVYIVQVDPSPEPVYCLFDGQHEFYVRALTTTRRPDAKEFLEYINEHFYAQR
ncbi:MAG: hypothetical protein GF309_01060 [Candidatus Lokiarchaeota archaeon]|nr:hypothetical protein [Candidatus Lokiarchaeota archaeon]